MSTDSKRKKTIFIKKKFFFEEGKNHPKFVERHKFTHSKSSVHIKYDKHKEMQRSTIS